MCWQGLNLPESTGNNVLICTYSAGFGHLKAARAIKDAFQNINPGQGVYIIDPFEFARPVLNGLLIDVYLMVLKRAPFIYRMLYEMAEKDSRGGLAYGFFWRLVFNRAFFRKLSLLMDEIHPSAIICSHPFAAVIMKMWQRRNGSDNPALTGLLTDYTIHPYWKNLNLDGYFIAAPDFLTGLTNCGISRERIWVTGIPVDRKFGASGNKEKARLELGLHPHKPTVLVMGGGLGLGSPDEVVWGLAASRLTLQLIAVTGVNVPLQKKMESMAKNLQVPLKIFGFVNNVAQLMTAADLIVSKPGGITVAEALAAQLPIIIWKPIPGHEVRNTSFLVDKGLARQVKNRTELAQTVTDILNQGSDIPVGLSDLYKVAAGNIAATVIKSFLS